MILCYQDNEVRRSSKPFFPEDYDANRMISKHLENYFFLKFILAKSDDIVEKHRASKELEICERKMNYWKRQVNFCQKQYEKDIQIWNKTYDLT